MEKIWQEALNQLENDLPHQTFNLWIKPILCGEKKEKDVLVLEVPNRFFKEWIKDHYYSNIQKAVNSASDKNVKIKIEISAKNKEKNINREKEIIYQEEKIEQPIKQEKINSQSYLNNDYTFEKFVSGSSNQFAYAASQAVANNPATTYNPLFIYGGVGLGKTHLINAIGNAIAENRKNSKVVYYTSERFTNELINCLRYHKMEEFRNKFRNVDVLLIDDVQFIAGKERTQEEFFHTFNSLYESKKQIVVTSDKFPREIPELEERIRSRFEWGLIADIQPPDQETKVAILKMKAELNGLPISDEVAYFLANSVCSNIRELEGHLVRIVAYANLMSVPVNEMTAREVLKDILIEKSREISIEEIQKVVGTYFNVKISDLRSAKRTKALVVPRQIAMYLARQLTTSSYPEIGDKFGGKDHSTIIYAIKKMESRLTSDVQLKNAVDVIRGMLNR